MTEERRKEIAIAAIKRVRDEWEYAPDVLERVIEKYGENSTPAKITRRWCAERKAVSQAVCGLLDALGLFTTNI